MIIASCYFGHECGMAFCNTKTNEYYTIEFEKVTGKRYCRDHDMSKKDLYMIRLEVEKILGKRTYVDRFIAETGKSKDSVFGYMIDHYDGRINPCNHHQAHAAVGYYTSPFDKAVIITCDGGGDRKTFTVSVCHGRDERIELLASYSDDDSVNLGAFYLAMSAWCSEVLYSGDYMSYAGKAMGLSGRGNIRDDWYDEIMKLCVNPLSSTAMVRWPWRRHWYDKHFKSLVEAIDPTGVCKLSGQDSYDLMATAQKVLQDRFHQLTDEWIQKYPGYDIVISGGVALNVLNNEHVKRTYPDRKVFVPSAPGDSGLALGRLLHSLKPKRQINALYLGPYLVNEMPTKEEVRKRVMLRGIRHVDNATIDLHERELNWANRIASLRNSTPVTKKEVAQMLADGKIIGVINGRSEFGPRALGSRSILCDPSYPDMRDKINKSIKSREWYRPFAPVCRLQDAEIYFDSSQFEMMSSMAFAPLVKPEWRDKLPSITHVDGTARLQTVVEQDQPWLYELLTEFADLTGRHVLLNTSFNIKGRAILNDIDDAVTALGSTDLDAVIVNDLMLVI